MEGYRKAVTRMTLDMSLPDVQKSFSCTKGDVNRRLEITLVDGGNPFAIPNNWTVFLAGTKPDETELYNGCVVERGKIIYDFASGVEIATCTGSFGIQFDIFDENGEPIASPKVWVHVLEAKRDVDSNNQFTALGDLIGKINEVQGDVNDLKEYVSDIESGIVQYPRVDVDCGGTAYSITVSNNTVYNLTNCSELTILLPDIADFSAHIFVKFVDEGDVGFILPDGMSVYGSDPTIIENGDDWELNIDSAGGILCLRKKV